MRIAIRKFSDFLTRISVFGLDPYGLKWVHMARYELILRLVGGIWLRIILKPLLTQKRAIKIKK